jgi:hypothetical protein
MRGLSNSTKELIEYAYRLLVADHPQTLRQLHYAVFSRREIPYENDQADYKRLSRATSVACRAYRAWELESGRDSDGDPPAYSIPADWMVDETRQPETVKRSYRRDNWQDQANYCEVWSEKATLLGAIRPVADAWGITLRVCHGFGSTGRRTTMSTLKLSLFLVVVLCTSTSAQTPKISWAQSALDITVLSGTVRATAIQFSSTGTLNNVSCNIGWAHQAWERCWRPAPRWHAPWSMRW